MRSIQKVKIILADENVFLVKKKKVKANIQIDRQTDRQTETLAQLSAVHMLSCVRVAQL